jgi:hypothetical protein
MYLLKYFEKSIYIIKKVAYQIDIPPFKLCSNYLFLNYLDAR